jgi:hypothetical protein
MNQSNHTAEQKLLDYYRVAPDSITQVSTSVDHLSTGIGFFQFGAAICYGRCQGGTAQQLPLSSQFDVSKHALFDGSTVQLPFSFAEVIDNLRLENYRQNLTPEREWLARSEFVRKVYYHVIRATLSPSIRRRLQKAYFSDWQQLSFPNWPVDFTVDVLHQELLRLLMEATGVKRVPFIWFWPEGASSCLIMTHDVETSVGRDFSSELMDLDDSYGIKASFQVIPEKRYEVSDNYVSEIRRRGFEFNLHDLNHDGHLYSGRQGFDSRAARINRYVQSYGARGFRAGSMYRRQEWYDVFKFSYDMSVPNVAHLEPMRGGCCTVMPYFVGDIVELPLTLIQDYSLIHILRDYSIDLWKQQLAEIQRQNGLMSFIVHPDYLIEPKALGTYQSLLEYLSQTIARDRIWAALPGQVDVWWRARSRMNLVLENSRWRITGPESERARLAYAVLDGDHVVYELASGTTIQ